MRPLEGLLAISLEQAIAGPMCGRLLADGGARVIKVERPEGDFARNYDRMLQGESIYFVWLNRGKESVVVDLANPEDKGLFEALVAKADILVQNLKPGALAKLGFAPDELVRRYPKLIACSISGYGETGPYAERKAYDMLIQAESGLASVTGSADEPSRVGISIVDITTGHHAYEAILEALIRRGRTGEGADIRLSMFDVMAEYMSVPLLQGIQGAPAARIGLRHTALAPYGVFTTKDGQPVLISIQNDREWRALCEKVLERPDVARDPKFAQNPDRVANREESDALIQAWFSTQTAADAIARLDAADIAFGRVSDWAALRDHPHLRMVEVGYAKGRVKMPAPAAIWKGGLDKAGSVPKLGADTERVRKEVLGR
ncbi:MAG: CaiB/BaiF CoA-transferase family protein [Hyphomicrobiaceae bacterium]|nr:CaiB/BaiF CoA-transferase family protein [Hyphomicrobiaceae bacterium]